MINHIKPRGGSSIKYIKYFVDQDILLMKNDSNTYSHFSINFYVDVGIY